MDLKLKVREQKSLVTFLVIGTILQFSHGCEIANHLWIVPIQAEILDIHDGIVLTRDTSDITGINSAVYGEAILGGPYFDIYVENSQLVVRTNEAFKRYEEVEIEQRVSITLEVNCADGTTRGGLFLWIDLNDTNNNSPIFLPTDEYEFVIMPPLPPGYLITGCYNDPITARDIDLTTQRIDFDIEDNPYLEIVYDAETSTVAKQFNAQLRTKALIRSLNEPLVLQITATDVDLTLDPARTTLGMVRIVPDPDANFQFPEELVFSQTFYLANYSDDHQLNLLETISLRQGFDEYVNYTLEGEHAENFNLIGIGFNQLSIVVKTRLPDEVISENHIFLVVKAQREYTSGASATVIVQFPRGKELQFERPIYEGTIVNNSLQIPPLILIQEYDGATISAEVFGEYSSYFTASVDDGVVILTMGQLPADVIDNNSFISLQVVAGVIGSASTVVNLDIIKDDNVTPVFDQTIYSGSYDPVIGLSVEQIVFVQGFDETVSVELFGEYSELFQVVENGPILTLSSSTIPPEMFSQGSILLSIVASKPLTVGANAAIYISLPAEISDSLFRFQEHFYKGFFENGTLTLDEIVLEEYTSDINYMLVGDHAENFQLTNQNGTFAVQLETPIANDILEDTTLFVLTLEANNAYATAYTVIVLENRRNFKNKEYQHIEFEQPYYLGTYSTLTDLQLDSDMKLTTEVSNVDFDLEGEDAEWFALERSDSAVTVTLRSTIPTAVLANNQQLVFVVTAQGHATNTARATVVIALTNSISETPVVLGFNQITYLGSIENNQTNTPIITLNQGYSEEVEFRLHGEFSDYFNLSPNGASVTVRLQNDIPQQLIPPNRIIVLEIQAIAPEAVTAYATIVLEYVTGDFINPAAELKFEQTFYSGSYAAATGLQFPTPISLSQGYDSNVVFDLEGDDAEWFALERSDSAVTLTLRSTIPAAVLANNQQLVFVVTAQGHATNTARATVVIALTDYPQPGLDVTFSKVLYEGTLRNDVVVHETISLVGFSGSTVELQGEYSSQFEASLFDGEVQVISSGSASIPASVTHVVLELHAGTASAVLLIRVVHSDKPVPSPIATTVSFDSTSYAFQVGAYHTGLVGRVQANASNGEAVTYSLLLDNGLQDRLTVNSDGEIHLSLLVSSGLYSFDVVATTVSSLVMATAPAHLSVESTPVCGDEHVMAPLIVLNVDEEEPHYGLMNATQYDNCHFNLTNRWPLNHTWLYVDERGLHATAIDREHESIAFMALSQVQVEVTLVCDSTRTKRSLTSDALGPYDYGTNKWILTEYISFNAKRSLVNIIVNDINDNAPIFVGKENEPIVIGYPVPDIAERVLPRSLVELQATDADIGENAALLYWSSEPELAVSPTTGFVHLRDRAMLENGSILKVNATDRNGLGWTGSIDIMVRLLDESYIAVVTVKDAFLDDEKSIVSSLSDAVGYDLKVLRSVVISGDAEASRKKRDLTNAGGASLQMYVYGLIASEPVPVGQLTTDISNIVTASVIVASSVSLQDHLEGQEICVIAGRDTGLLVATIVLSVLLFILLALIAVWFYLRWRKNRNYDQFSDQNSIASRNVSEDGISKPDVMPRLDIEELRKSERRLQEMLETPVEEVYVEPTNSKNDAVVDIPDSTASIITIDKLKDADDASDDEFGEVKTPRRKSVVTFNENVEKIIHLEDTPDTDEGDASSEPEIEVYQL